MSRTYVFQQTPPQHVRGRDVHVDAVSDRWAILDVEGDSVTVVWMQVQELSLYTTLVMSNIRLVQQVRLFGSLLVIIY